MQDTNTLVLFARAARGSNSALERVARRLPRSLFGDWMVLLVNTVCLEESQHVLPPCDLFPLHREVTRDDWERILRRSSDSSESGFVRSLL